MRSSSLALAVVTVLALLLAAPLAAAAPASEAELDARTHALSQQLRCVVCQNQTLADSNADLAVDLRRQIRQQLAGGADEQAVKDWLTQRYGGFVLYKPPLGPRTWLLWFGPVLLLVFVVAVLFMRRRRAQAPEASALKADERQLLDAMLEPADKEPSR
ncbi:MAG: cytochrome c-type biogenesis protein CcmH [Proteobacteria bacterium]|nr:cytochrome c-type biogenesis protein CcmH [Pseudomonadota bacterium]